MHDYIFEIGIKNIFLHTIDYFSVNFLTGESYLIRLCWIWRNLLPTTLVFPVHALLVLLVQKKPNYILKILDNTHTQYAYHSNCYLPIICIINSLNLICSSRLSDVVPNSCPRPSLSAWCRWRVGCLNKHVCSLYLSNNLYIYQWDVYNIHTFSFDVVRPLSISVVRTDVYVLTGLT